MAVRDGESLRRLREDPLTWAQAKLVAPFRDRDWDSGPLSALRPKLPPAQRLEPEFMASLIDPELGSRAIYQTHLRRGPRMAYFLEFPLDAEGHAQRQALAKGVIFGADHFADHAAGMQGDYLRFSSAAFVRQAVATIDAISWSTLPDLYRVDVLQRGAKPERVQPWLDSIREGFAELRDYYAGVAERGLVVIVIDE